MEIKHEILQNLWNECKTHYYNKEWDKAIPIAEEMLKWLSELTLKGVTIINKTHIDIWKSERAWLVIEKSGKLPPIYDQKDLDWVYGKNQYVLEDGQFIKKQEDNFHIEEDESLTEEEIKQIIDTYDDNFVVGS